MKGEKNILHGVNYTLALNPKIKFSSALKIACSEKNSERL